MATSVARGSAARGDAGDALSVESLDAGYGSHLVVKGASLRITRGQVTCLLGPNGAGKSTLLKALIGIARCSAGHVRADGADITNRRTEELAAMGLAYVPQLDDVFGPLTVIENLEMGGFRLDGPRLRRRIADTLEEFPQLGRLRGRRASSLSGGERKLLAMARALMVESRYLLADEPTAGLSPTMAETVLAELRRIATSANVGVLLVEQRARAALEVSDFGHILVGGAIRLYARSEELLARPDLGDLLIGAVAREAHLGPEERRH